MKHRYTSHHEIEFPMPDWAAGMSEDDQEVILRAAKGFDDGPFLYWAEDFQDDIDAGYSEEAALERVNGLYLADMMAAYEKANALPPPPNNARRGEAEALLA